MKGVKAAVRGAQETLGFDSPSHMKGLQVFIADIRNCQTKEQERTRVDKELSKIRQKFANPKTLSGYDRKKYVWKLLYAYMLGYEIDDTGHFQAVELCSSPKFSEKTAGYLATSLLLADNNDMVRMIVNSVKTDICSGNEHMAALALNTVANIGGPEFADNLFTDIARMILTQANALSPYVKRKACICLLRLYRKENDGLQPEDRQEEEGSELPPLMFGGLVSEARGALQRAGHRPADVRQRLHAGHLGDGEVPRPRVVGRCGARVPVPGQLGSGPLPRALRVLPRSCTLAAEQAASHPAVLPGFHL